MTQAEFQKLPWLLLEKQVMALGYDRRTVGKFVACEVLRKVMPTGSRHARYQKRQVAQLLTWDVMAAEREFAREKLLMPFKAVQTWTGYDKKTLVKIVKAGGLTLVKPPGSSHGKYLKTEIAGLIGFAI